MQRSMLGAAAVVGTKVPVDILVIDKAEKATED